MRWLCFFALIFAHGPLQANFEISHGDLQDSLMVAKDLVATYNPAETVFVGIGRSPAPVTAMLQAIGAPSVVNVPFTTIDVFDPRTGEVDAIHELEKRYVFKHLDHTLNNRADLSGKNVVIMDYVIEGRSLASATVYFEMYFEDPRSRWQKPPKLVNYAFAEDIEDKLFAEQIFKNIRTKPRFFVLPENSPLSRVFMGGYFKDYAEFGEYKLPALTEKNYRPPTKNPGHSVLISAIEEFLSAHRHLVPIWSCRGLF